MAYLWSPEIDAEFNCARKILSSPLLVQPFDPSLETHFLNNANKKHGLGYALIEYNTRVLKTHLPDISNTRLVKYREILSSYSFTVDWNAGKDHLTADALSRAP
ncbi:hypothetical protein TCAL_15631, partial [Tigriopus californicus]